jgi:hypothetical protein
MRTTILTLAALLLLLAPAAVRAQDAALGITVARAPAFDGQRAITAMFQAPPAGSTYYQEPIGRSVPQGRSRVLLEYTTAEENWSVRRSIVADVEGLRNGRFRVTAILPQGQVGEIPDPVTALTGAQLPRHQDARYHRNPLKITHGTTVLYRWRREERNGRVDGDVHTFQMPHPLVITIMGDSYGSGEGAPDGQSTFLEQVSWEDRDSHRSNRSGHLRGVGQFRLAHPELWIESLHVGISGATLSTLDSASSGFLTDYSGDRELKVLGIPIPVPMRPDVTAESQFSRVERWIAQNGFDRTHVLVISGGGNDAGFTDIIVGAVIGTLRFDFGNTLRAFRGNLAALKQTAEQEFKPALDEMIRPQHVLWTTYPNLTRDQNGAHTDIVLRPGLNLNPGLMALDLAVGGDDMENAELLLTEELNPAIRDICNQILDRCQVVDVEDAAIGHGINADLENRWFNTFSDAQDAVQGSIDGAVHPNEQGQSIYSTGVLEKLVALYHPVTGSEYRRMNAEARAAVRRGSRTIAEDPRRAAVRNAAEHARLREQLTRKARMLAVQRAERAERENRDRLRLENILENRLRSADLRLVLPSTARVAELRSSLTRAGEGTRLRELDSALAELKSLEQLDSRALRRTIEQHRAKEGPSPSRVRPARPRGQN